MNKSCLWIVAFLFFFLCVVQVSFAQNWIFANNNLKLRSLAATPEGLEFTIKSPKNIPVAPNSSCLNEFIVPKVHEDYDLLAAFLLTASAKKKKVGIVYDDDSTECQVEVQSVVVY